MRLFSNKMTRQSEGDSNTKRLEKVHHVAEIHRKAPFAIRSDEFPRSQHISISFTEAFPFIVLILAHRLSDFLV